MICRRRSSRGSCRSEWSGSRSRRLEDARLVQWPRRGRRPCDATGGDWCEGSSRLSPGCYSRLGSAAIASRVLLSLGDRQRHAGTVLRLRWAARQRSSDGERYGDV